MNDKNDVHLDIYLDRQVLHVGEGNEVYCYYEGTQSTAAKRRYEKIKKTLSSDYLQNKLNAINEVDYTELSDENKDLLEALVRGVSSEKGRGLLGVAFLQIVIKAITPEQSVRLHKTSWVEGISMRSLNSKYTGVFLKENGFLNSNKFGSFMTRTLAENYPYSKLYKAKMEGPFDEWIAVVDALENNTMPAELALSYLMMLMKNNSDKFKRLAGDTVKLAQEYTVVDFSTVQRLMTDFYSSTYGKARAFEVVMHGLMQALAEMDIIGDSELVPLSQMRSANKKHGNVGDIEFARDEIIIEAWDAKYGKTYLWDELDELRDKLNNNPDVEIAGFVADKDVDRTADIKDKIHDVSMDTSTDIVICSFDEWVELKTRNLATEDRNLAAKKWLIAVVETFALKRPKYAPIEEPSEIWLQDISKLLRT